MAAPINLDDLGGFLGEVLGDTRTVKDPWGFGIEATITHTGNEGWEKFEAERLNASPLIQNQRDATADYIAAPTQQAGFRAQKAPTAAERAKALRRKLAQKTDAQTATETIRAQKPGIVDHLLLEMTFRGGTIIHRGDQTFDLSLPLGRLAFLAHTTWKTPGGDQVSPVFELGPDGQPALDAEGEPLAARFGGKNLGDATALWLLEESGLTAEFVRKEEAANQGKSGAISNGAIETGSLARFPSAEG